MNAIEIKNLTKEYKDFKLDNINLTLPMGCILGLVGENGAGKSTTIKLLLNAIRPNHGEITILGKGSQTEEFRLAKEEVGVVLDNTGIPGGLHAGQVGNVMSSAYANWDKEEYQRYLERFSLPLKKQVKDYSKGMKMKLAIAIALSHKAKLLILDEATSGLDPIARDEILDVFLEFTRNEEHSILLSSHIVSDLEKICDYIAFLHKGKLVFHEEKDKLEEDYCMLMCKKQDVEVLDKKYVVGIREGKYGAEVLMRADGVPHGMQTQKAGIEDIMLFMVKGNLSKRGGSDNDGIA